MNFAPDDLLAPNGIESYRTGSGPGSPRGQPAWGGGCDRIKYSSNLCDPVATALGSDSVANDLLIPPRR